MCRPMPQLARFDEYCLDYDARVLLRNGDPVPIRRKIWECLSLLIEEPGKVIPIEELRARVWGQVQVSEGSVHTLLYELRRVLGDSAERPRFIETIPARGIRFSAAVEWRMRESDQDFMVGREAELSRLETVWARVVVGERQLVVVRGDPGIGKSHLVRHFTDRIGARHDPPVRVLIGRCFAREGGAPAFLPVFDILDAWHQAETSAEASPIIDLLRRHAPRWARQIPWVGKRTTASALSAAEARPERFLQEIAAVFERGSADRPLVLIFEDVHWADRATVELVHYLATRSTRAALLVIATYRETDAIAKGHPALHLPEAPRDRLTVIDLPPFGRDEVRRCLAHVFADSPEVVADLVDDALRRSGGNPLLVLALAQWAIDQGIVSRRGARWQLESTGGIAAVVVSSAVKQLLEHHLATLTPTQRQVIEAAAVAGEEMDAAAVAAGLGRDVEEVDTELRHLSLGSALVREVGASSWPDGTTAGRFRFRHSLYQEAVYQGLPVARRARLHRRIGMALEAGHVPAPDTIIAQLAQHFEAGGDHARAAYYLERAAVQMIARSALPEARAFYRRALDQLSLLADDSARAALGVRIWTGFGLTAALIEGLGSAVIQESYDAVTRLRGRVSDASALFPTLRILWVFELLRFGYAAMRNLNEQMQALAAASGGAMYASLAASMTGTTHAFLGELGRAQFCLEASIASCDDASLLPAPYAWLVDPRVETRCVLAWVLWLRGEFARSRLTLAAAEKLAQESGHESTRGLALWFRSSLAQLDGDAKATRRAAADLKGLATESGLPAWLQIAALTRALGELSDGAPSALESALASMAASDGNPTVAIARAYLLGQLAMAYARQGKAGEGLALVEFALARVGDNGARVSEADLLRIRGELREAMGDDLGAEVAYRAAIAVAQQQEARAFELRAATARVRLLRRLGDHRLATARQDLRRVCDELTDDARDIRIARETLEAT